ncbi:MAG: choice-of-anchor J domain-containing protein, partial [Bacteroidales bacterium]|nr:choice-of-anchor J domain-containing protein [Bacteroidales bacterium]
GVGCVYGGNRGEEVESPITWANVENNSVENVMAYEPATAPNMEQLTGKRTAPAKFHEIKSNNPFRGSTGYVDNTYGYVIPSGLCVLDIDNPQGATSLNPSSSLYAGEIVDGVIYGYTSDGYFVTFDPETGAQLSSVYAGTGIREMAYDYTTSTMYGSSTSDNNLYRIDMTNGSYTVVGTMSNVSAVAGLVCDLTGQLYAMAFTTGDLYKVDKNTAAMTLVGNTGRTPAYVQSAAIDYATGICYWAYSDASYDDLYTVDLATAQASFVCSFVESCGLCFPRAGAPVPPGPDPQHSEIQEPRESPIVWSNCLDKDMYLNGAVDITVLLNSADSPEGTTVSFRNLNEFEQELYPVAPVVLDSTGYYVWDSFRRGEYEINVAMNGYESITTEVSIQNATSLRYVLVEIIYGVSDLYVSHTGWAMWAGQDGPVPPHGDGDTFEFGFDSGLDGWTTINADGDDHNWYHSSEAGNHSTLAITSHSGAGHMMSESYCNATWAALHPDEYLVAPQMYNIAAGSTFSFYACAQDASYAAEHFGVAISTNGNTNAADFTTIQEWTLTAKGGAKANPAATRDGEGTREGNWYQYTCDLSAYAGQQVWIAIRHFNCTDQFIMCMDDAELTTGAKSDERHLEGYKVLCTSIDGEPIFSGNTVHPFCQVDTDELVEGENYICKVAAIYSTGMSDWTVAEWQYKSCENYGEAQNVAAEGQTITWEYPAGPVPPPIGDGDEFSFSFDSNADGWTTINADGDDHNWYHSSEAGNHSTLAITSHSGAGHMMSESYCNATWAALHPDEYLVTPQMYNIAAGSTFSFWACAQDASYAAEHFGVAISTNGNTNAADFTTIQEWTLTAKGGAKANPAATRDGEGTREGNWYQYTCDLSAYAGQQVWIAIRHFNCTDMFIMCMDDAQLTAGAKSNRDEYIQYCTETFSGGVGTGGGEVWWAVKFPASSLASYAGQTLTKLGVFTDVDGDYGWTYSGNYELSVYAGTSAPTTLLGTTGMQYVAGDLAWHDLDLQDPVTIEGTQDLWIMGHTLDIAYPMSGCDYVGDANSDYLSLDGSLWEHANDYALAYTWMLRGLVGGSQPGPEPTGEVIGAMIFRDGEWLAEVPYPVSEYTDEEGSGNYCVRIIYNGTAVLPDQNEYYSMSCPVCTESDDCAPGADIYGEYVWNNANDYGALITWGGAPVPPPGPGDEFTEGFESGSIPTGWTTIDADGDGHNWSPASVLMAGYLIPAHGGADCFTSESYSSTYGALTPDNFLVSPQVAIANGSQFSFWACAQDPSYAGEHYGVAISMTGNTNPADFTTIAEWTMTAKDAAEAGAYMSKDGKGTREGTWYQKTVDLSDYAGQQIYIAIRHFNCTDMFYLNVDDAELSVGAKASLATAVKYNVYRSTDNVNYTFIGEVPVVPGQTEYSYFDNEVAAGLYYYQVRAEYSDGCESEPAASGANPDNNYVIVNVTSVAENGEIALYPNPTNGNITIQAQNMNRITVVSVLGQVVYDAEVEGEQQIINMAQFNAGVYMVRIATENGVSTQRVTVVK